MRNIWHYWKKNEEEFYSVTPPTKVSCKYVSLPESTEDRLKLLSENLGKIDRIYEHIKLVELNIPFDPFDEDENVNAEENGVELPAGAYTLQEDRYSTPRIRLIPMDIRGDQFIRDEFLYNSVVRELEVFRENEAIYRETKSIYKRSVLLYGAPGFGKSSLIRDIIKHNLKDDAVVIFFNNAPSIQMIKVISTSLKGREKFFVFEELLQIMESFSGAQGFLEFMDGERSLDGAFIVGTTNYPEKLPENMTDRPSRWDALVKVDDSTLTNQVNVLTHFLGRTPLQEEIDAVKGMSAAYIKELVFLMRLHNYTIKDALKRIKDRKKLVKNDFVERKQDGIGFGAK